LERGEHTVLNQNSVFGRRDRVIAQQVEEQTVLLDIESGQYFALNEVGKSVWDLCDGTRTVAQVADAICSGYDVVEEVALTDASALLEALAGVGLVSTT
jgi:aspartate aminotransferase-like enzyme